MYKAIFFNVVIYLSLQLSVGIEFGNSVKTIGEYFYWNILDYAYPNQAERYRAIRSREFIPENNLPVGIERWNDKLFVTVPRWREGIPSTLNYIPLYQTTSTSPPLIPYPNWASNRAGDCQNGLTNIYRIKADECDRLWVLDTGTFGIENTTTNLCPYTLNVFDLHTNRIIRKYQLRPDDINGNTFIANIAVDVGKTCEDAFAYMSDELGYGLIVYSWKENKSWRFSHGFFLPDPLAGDFNIGGLNFQWFEEGIFGMALSPLRSDGTRVLFFSPLASNREFAVSTSTLQNEENVENSYADFIALSDRGTGWHTTARVMDPNGVEFFNLVDRNAIGCWNSALPHRIENFDEVLRDNKTLIFPSDVKIDETGNLWVMSEKMPVFLLSNLDYFDINFRIFVTPIQDLIKGTACEYISSWE